jgi:large subunit ribosomal protein L29
MSKRNDFVNNLKDLSETDLLAKVREDEQRLKKLEFAHAISPLESPVNIRMIRKDIARLKTELTKRKIGKPVTEKV